MSGKVNKSIADKILTTINAPYGKNVTDMQLVRMLTDGTASQRPEVFAFFSEVSKDLQDQFILEYNINERYIACARDHWSRVSGYRL